VTVRRNVLSIAFSEKNGTVRNARSSVDDHRHIIGREKVEFEIQLGNPLVAITINSDYKGNN
jgi:hypothetical protein